MATRGIPQTTSLNDPMLYGNMNNLVNAAQLRTMPQMVTTVLPAGQPQQMVNATAVVTPTAAVVQQNQPGPQTATASGVDPLLTLKSQLLELHKVNQSLRVDVESTTQKLQSSMSSIKTFWSPELKKERALRKEEIAKFALVQEQLRLANLENQVRAKIPPGLSFRTKKDCLISMQLISPS